MNNKTQVHVLAINPRAQIVADNRQWIVQVRSKASAPWKSKHFISSTRGVLLMTLDENKIHPTDKGKDAIHALPNTYKLWADEHLAAA